MKNLWVVFFALIGTIINAQDLKKTAKEIQEEGIELYRSEMASWYGTDVLKANYDKMENIKGYFSYIDGGVPKCIFFSENSKVLATVAFPANYNPRDAKIDMNERDFTSKELDYFTIRQNANEKVKTDTIFQEYNNTSINLIPIIDKNNVKKVYAVTGPSVDNIVIFGNDYLISFNDKNEVKNIEKLHKGIIVQAMKEEKLENAISGLHSHVLENQQAITPTDICTLMLYYKFTNWNDYFVISKDFVSIWSNKTNNLVIIKEKDVKKMAGSVENSEK
ncbi:hypothetical protein [Chryseobacterium limigenitum]|uniref:Uncharacterized protein n=1 Tax=Chryseobacterium limigenitum TaxID=1612149 RepID=A0A1K2IUY1_9FLAO|nr:hypothetical protein [Chryseobacterium limigenitum]SFZ96167.1 hypothetical protein SAMN05216324_11677 [Chryseobacterium limigenitum]